MSETLFLTVGTSLLESATWEATEWVLKRAPSYGDWTRSGELLASPDQRRWAGGRSEIIRAELREALHRFGAEEWADSLPEDLEAGRPRPGTAMRYSAELATLVKMAEGREGEAPLKGLLGAYGQIRIAVDPTLSEDGRKNDSHIAGNHLRTYIDRISGAATASLLPIPGLASIEPAELFKKGEGLSQLVREVERLLGGGGGIDLVVTGGYKIYGVVLGQVLFSEVGREARLHYIHETAHELVSMDRGHLRVAGRTGGNPASILYQPGPGD